MKVLEAWLEGRHVGRFWQTDGIRTAFEYDEPNGLLISASLARDGSWSAQAPARFLDNLLPDRAETRRRMAYDTGASSADVFDLLEKVGTDVAGGLVLTPEGVEPFVEDTPLVRATDDEIAYRIDQLKRDQDMWLDPEVKARFSLAGAQAKFALARVADEWYWSSANLPSTHILKPGSPRTPDAEQIEVASMRLSRSVGIPTPHASVLEVYGQSAYMVARFDREPDGDTVRRIHTEDFAQAAGQGPDAKYAMAAHQAVKLLRTVDLSDTLGYQFVNRLAFSTSIANADAHAKNYSLMIRPEGVTLAPAYDVLVTTYWDYVDERLAMRIGGASRSAEVTAHHWAKLARSSGLDEDRVVHIAVEMSAAVVDLLDDATSDLPSQTRDKVRSIVRQANTGMSRRRAHDNDPATSETPSSRGTQDGVS
ncbi:MAG: HipA domain-containing protein [Micrococcales bacterium]|nr:HipA domain-containing protein [Micrococcales bacterium]MCL2668502.1 HipA domain-containing protein [Micrococcales bacterium]